MNVAELGIGQDNLAYEPEVAAMIATEFEHLTMRRIPAPELIGLLTRYRKLGLLPKVSKEPLDGTADGFDHINDVA